MKKCMFVAAQAGVVCAYCGRFLATSHPPERCHAVCLAGDCRHLGPELRRANCPTCAGHVQVKVFECSVYGECTLAKKIGSIACCQTCERYEAASSHAAEESRDRPL